MNWRIEEKGEFEVFGIEETFRNDSKTNLVSEFWDRCTADGSLERLADAANDHHGIGLGICGACYPDTNVFPYLIARYVGENCDTSGFKTLKMPAQMWAVFRADVDEYGDKIIELFGRIYSEWFSNSGYDKVDGWDIEVYDEYPDGKKYEEVWVPVKPCK